MEPEEYQKDKNVGVIYRPGPEDIYRYRQEEGKADRILTGHLSLTENVIPVKNEMRFSRLPILLEPVIDGKITVYLSPRQVIREVDYTVRIGPEPGVISPQAEYNHREKKDRENRWQKKC